MVKCRERINALRVIAGGCVGLLTAGIPVPGEAHGRRPAPTVREADFSGSAYLSLEDVAGAMGGFLKWLPVSQRVDVSFPSHKVEFSIGSKHVVVDGHPTELDHPTVADARGIWVTGSFFVSGPLASSFRKRINLNEKKATENRTVALRKASDEPRAANKDVIPAEAGIQGRSQNASGPPLTARGGDILDEPIAHA